MKIILMICEGYFIFARFIHGKEGMSHKGKEVLFYIFIIIKINLKLNIGILVDCVYLEN